MATSIEERVNSRRIEEEVNLEEELKKEWKEKQAQWTEKISIPPNTEFCPLLNYPSSNCNEKGYSDGNCFKTKMSGCINGKIYLQLKKHLPEKHSLYLSSKISKIINFFKPRI